MTPPSPAESRSAGIDTASPERPERRWWRWLVWLLLPLLIGTVLGVGYLRVALRKEPEFYRRATEQLADETARQAAVDEFERRAQSVAEAVKKKETWRETFTQTQLNAWLAEEYPRRAGRELPPGVSPPLLELDEGTIRIGSKVETDQYRGIVSVHLRATLEGDERIVLDVQSVRAGEVPIPAGRWISQIRKKVADAPGVRLEETPHLRLIISVRDLHSSLADLDLTELTVSSEGIDIAGTRRDLARTGDSADDDGHPR